jgi:hypothetical protein
MKLKISYKDFVNTYPEVYKAALFYPKFLRLKKNKLSFRQVKNILSSKVPISTLYFWYNNKRIPMPFKEFSKIKKEFNKNDLENLATIVGHILGDGGITKEKILRYCNTEEFLIQEFQNAIENVFDVKPMNKFKENSGIIRLDYSRLISRILLCLFGEFSLGEENKKITHQIDKMPIWWKVKLLQALYDDDGSVPESGHYVGVTFKQKNKAITLWVQKVLRQLNIVSRLTKDGSKWHLRITNYLNLMKFRDKVNFSRGYRKQIHLDKIIEKIKFPHWKTKNQIIELLIEKPRTRKELTYLLKLKPGTIYGHLHGWKRKKIKSNKGLIDLKFVKMKKVGRINLYYV